ncbi:endo-beta-N-acetylglucosaminidase [Streptomyces sp. NPDC002851]
MPHARPTRRTLLLSGAGALTAALLPNAAAAVATEASRARAAGSLQPYASYWFPDRLPSGTPGEGVVWRSLKEWTPDSDPDLAFNTSTVPLAERFAPVPVNATARADQARITALVAFDTTSGNPSQGAPDADYYALSHWAYIDELVFWGGSSGEGIVLAPNAPVVDAAHRNGVTVLGNVFLPPAAYGGKLDWTRDLVQRDANGGFPIAAKLAEVAAAYGFDGWFINAETDGGDTQLATDMRDFLLALRRLGAERGLRIQWYDSMVASGAVNWQDELNDSNRQFFQSTEPGAAGRVSDSMFLNFNWTARKLTDSGRLAEELGRSRYELWAGVDVESNGWNTSVDWDAVVPRERPHLTSYGFYRPEWTLHHLPEGRTPGQFHAADDRFWSGAGLDPAHPDPGATWRAPAAVVADRSTITALPFATSFNTGHGLRWYEDGVAVTDTPWNHLGLQDRLPARRWMVRTEQATSSRTSERPAVSLDFADAWRGGSSLLVDGVTAAPATMDLYATRLPLGPDTVVELTHRAAAGPVTVELAVATAEPDGPGAAPPYTYLPVGTVEPGGWSTKTVRLGDVGVGTVHALGVRLTAAGGRGGSGRAATSWRLGALAVHDGTHGEQHAAAPSDFRVTKAAGGEFRFGWRSAPDKLSVRHYELHRVLPDGSRRFLGGTPGSAFYVQGLAPEQGERAARFELRAVDELYTASTPATTTYPW